MKIVSIILVLLISVVSAAAELGGPGLEVKVGPNKVICTNYIVGDLQLNYFLHKNSEVEGGLEIKGLQIKLLYSQAYRDHGVSVPVKATEVRLVSYNRPENEESKRNRYYLDVKLDQTQLVANIPYLGIRSGVKRLNVGGVIAFRGDDKSKPLNSILQQVQVPEHEDSALNLIFPIQCDLAD